MTVKTFTFTISGEQLVHASGNITIPEAIAILHEIDIADRIAKSKQQEDKQDGESKEDISRTD
jgi:DNA-binding transcriptional regulator PaaX